MYGILIICDDDDSNGYDDDDDCLCKKVVCGIEWSDDVVDVWIICAV